MRLSEDRPLDPEALAELGAIDATLRGEAVDPAQAEVAELALFLAAERPQMPAEAAQSLDRMLARRFAPVVAGPRAGGGALAGDDDPSASTGVGGRGGRSSRSWGQRLHGWAKRPALGIGLAGVAALVVVGALVLNPGQTGGYSSATIAGASAGATSIVTTIAPAPARSPATGLPSSSTPGRLASPQSAGASPNATPGNTTARAAASAPASQAAAGSAGQSEPASPPGAQTVAAPGVPAPASNGRKTIQSAQLQLIASGDRIDAVSQEVFDVVGLAGGIVKSSTITAAGGDNGYASFQLSIPSANLATAMTQLSQLRYARVASRTDATEDVNGQYLSDVRTLADAQALRTGLLKQLAGATTQAQIDSLTAQIHDAEATIAGEEAIVTSLNSRVAYSQLQVQINAGTITPAPSPASASGFTFGQASHDAVRVLTIAAGVGLIALATLAPIALLVALVLWILHALRRHRREAALDTA
ncbi:MAG: DUF4349 domain-containing protein [Solirubrobacteraceae bacterium]